MDHSLIFILLTAMVGLWMTWGVGANDLANIMSTALGSHSISARQALVIAVLFEIMGAFFGGSEVSETIRGGIVNLNVVGSMPDLLIYGMLSALFSAATWITLASLLGMPVSITNSIVGALVGVGVLVFGIHAVHWNIITYIMLSWISAPLIAGIVSYFLFVSIKRSILGTEDPSNAARRFMPIYLGLVGVVLAFMTALKGIDHFHLRWSMLAKCGVVFLTICIVQCVGWIAMRRIHQRARANLHTQFQYVENLFSVLMAFTACAMVFAHGSNDVAIAVGPMASIMGLVLSGHPLQDGNLYNGMMLFGCIGVVLGLVLLSFAFED